MPKSTPTAAILLLVVISIIAMGGLWGVSTAVSDVSNETYINTTVAQSTVWQDLGGPENATRYTDPVVTNSSGELNTTHYTFDADAGRIRFATNNSDNATVATTALETPPNAGPILSTLDVLVQIPGWIVLIAGAAAVLVGVTTLSNRRSRGGPI